MATLRSYPAGDGSATPGLPGPTSVHRPVAPGVLSPAEAATGSREDWGGNGV
jgi:hypothetical protein